VRATQLTVAGASLASLPHGELIDYCKTRDHPRYNLIDRRIRREVGLLIGIFHPIAVSMRSMPDDLVLAVFFFDTPYRCTARECRPSLHTGVSRPAAANRPSVEEER
jgi:hypothetical protein